MKKPYAAHIPLYNVLYVKYTLCIVYCTYCVVCVRTTLYNVICCAYNDYNWVYSEQRALYAVHCTQYMVWRTLFAYIVRCVMFSDAL